MKPKILVTTPLHFLPGIKQELMKIGECVLAAHSSKKKIYELVSDIDIWICQPCPEYKIDKSLIKKTKKLKLIISTSTGTNHIDEEACGEFGIKVVSLKGNKRVGTITASSEFTFNLVLSTIRRTPFAFESVKAGHWRDVEDKFRGEEVNGKTMGIIGFGRIGSNNARYAHAFGMRVIAYDPYVEIDDKNVEQKSRYQDVLREADVVLICVHLNKETEGMVDDSWFNLMKHGVYFINTSRGEIVNESALLNNLRSRKIAVAGLDVISKEPTSDKKKHPVLEYARKHSNLIVTPHIAGLTYDSERKAAEITIDIVREFWKKRESSLKILYWISSGGDKRVILPFSKRDDVCQAIAMQKGISKSGLKITPIYQHLSDNIFGAIKRANPDAFVQCNTSKPIHNELKKWGIKHIYVHHGIWAESPNNTERVSGSFWEDFDLLCGATPRFKKIFRENSNADTQIVTNTLPQLDLLYSALQDQKNIRDRILKQSKNPNAEKIISFFGHNCENRVSVNPFNEGYYRTAINLAKLAEKNNWLLILKPKRIRVDKFLSNVAEDWAKEIRDDYLAIKNSPYVYMVHPTSEAYEYFCADVIVSSARSTIEIEALLADKPLVRIWTPTFDVDDDYYKFEHGILESGAAYILDDMNKIEEVMLQAIAYDDEEIKKNRLEFIKRTEITLDGKAHERVVEAICNLCRKK